MNVQDPGEVAEECKICGARSLYFGSAKVLGKYEVRYFQCPDCSFMQTENPFWLDEAYSSAITSSDIGYVFRNQATQRKTRALISTFFDPAGRFLDYGGGYGMMVRMMRDAGFDFYRSDRYCSNLFASGFDAPADARGFELLTAFEVFEHLVSPREELAAMLEFSSSVFFSTNLLPDPAPPLGRWWYYGLEHGQHVALHTGKSLEKLGSLHGLGLVSDGQTLHLLTAKAVPERLYRRAIHRGARFINLLKRRPSLLLSDFAAATGQVLGSDSSTAPRRS